MQQSIIKGILEEIWLGGKVIYKELYKRLIFDHTDKWYIHKQESVFENGIQFSGILRYKKISQFWPEDQAKS